MDKLKIKIISQGDQPIRVYHDPRDVIYNKEEKTATVSETNEKFVIEKRDLVWVSCPNDPRIEEIHVILYVKNSSQYDHGKEELED